nr:Imm61 family immunity protein [Microbacterium luticocti]
MRYTIRHPSPDSWLLSRAERGEGEQSVMWTLDLTDIERMVTGLIGVDLRSRLGLPHLARPFTPAQAMGGFSVEAAPEGGFMLRSASGLDVTARFAREYGGSGAAGFSQLAGFSPAEIRDAFLRADGQPLSSDVA